MFRGYPPIFWIILIGGATLVTWLFMSFIMGWVNTI